LEIINGKVNSLFADTPPVLSFIPQKPLNGELLLQVCLLEKDSRQQICYRQIAGIKYITIEDDSSKELITGGIISDDPDAGRFDQAVSVFNKIHSILNEEQMPVHSIVRQWNYIESITAQSSDIQNYQEFNRARAGFYSLTTWENGYPAATGIGIKTGGIIVEIEALKSLSESTRTVAINNSFQVPAHQYSCKVLSGKDSLAATPKFERGRMVISPHFTYLYVSGTAAIRGERSIYEADAVRQTRLTMENIYNLFPAANLHAGTQMELEPVFGALIIYIKNESDYLDIKGFMDNSFPKANPVYLFAGVCRDELLVEIEAIVSFH
jgi:enamine deaminase RidA (YjgF/YER057c/UK114 family)